MAGKNPPFATIKLLLVLMDWRLNSKWCSVVIATSLSLGLGAAYFKCHRRSDRKAEAEEDDPLSVSPAPPVRREEMAAASDMDSTLHQAHPVNDLISSVRHISLDSPVAASSSSAAAASSAAVEISDRDSANHSPSDFLSGINHSDTHSEVFFNLKSFSLFIETSL